MNIINSSLQLSYKINGDQVKENTVDPSMSSRTYFFAFKIKTGFIRPEIYNIKMNVLKCLENQIY